MKLFVVACVLSLLPLGARQEPAPEVVGEGVGLLEIERGFVGVRNGDGWYQDVFGLVLEGGQKRTDVLDWTVGHDGADTVIVDIGSRMESGVRLKLHFRFAGESLVECRASGRWRFDFGSKPSDFGGELENVSGLVRLYSRDGERSKFSCLFTIHGLAARSADKQGPPYLLMGGFAIDRPFGEASKSK